MEADEIFRCAAWIKWVVCLRMTLAGRVPAPPERMAVAVRGYLRSQSRHVVAELPAERGIEVDHVTSYRPAQQFTPLLVNRHP